MPDPVSSLGGQTDGAAGPSAVDDGGRLDRSRRCGRGRSRGARAQDKGTRDRERDRVMDGSARHYLLLVLMSTVQAPP